MAPLILKLLPDNGDEIKRTGLKNPAQDAIFDRTGRYRVNNSILKFNLQDSFPMFSFVRLENRHFTAKMIMLPERADVDFPFEEQLIIELYSK